MILLSTEVRIILLHITLLSIIISGNQIISVTLRTQFKVQSPDPLLESSTSLHFHFYFTGSQLNSPSSVTNMSWRSQGITGSNNIPLGSRRKFGGSDSTPPADDGYNPSQPLGGMSDGNYKRGRSPDRGEIPLYPTSAGYSTDSP